MGEPAKAHDGATVPAADFWGRPLGLAGARVCRYPFINLSRRGG